MFVCVCVCVCVFVAGSQSSPQVSYVTFTFHSLDPWLLCPTFPPSCHPLLSLRSFPKTKSNHSLVTDDVIPIVLPHKNHAGNNIPVKCLSVSPAGNLIAAGCDDGAVRVWAYGDADDDAAWGGGKHNTRGAGRDKFGNGQVYRREASQQPRPVLPPPVVAQATSASPAAPESPDGNMLNGLAAATAAALGGPSLVATAGVTAEGGGAAEVETIDSGSLARAALGSASSASRAWNRVGGIGAVVGALSGNDLPGLGGGQIAAASVSTADGEGGRGGQVEERGRERRTRGRGREGGSGADDAGAAGKDKGELEVRLGTMLFGELSYSNYIMCLLGGGPA